MTHLESLQTGLIANITGPVTKLMFMIFGAMMLYGVMFYALRKFGEVIYLKTGHENELLMPGIGDLETSRRLRDSHKGTAIGDVYAYQYKTDLNEYVDGRSNNRSIEGDLFNGELANLSLESRSESIHADDSLARLIDFGPDEDDFENLRMERDS